MSNFYTPGVNNWRNVTGSSTNNPGLTASIRSRLASLPPSLSNSNYSSLPSSSNLRTQSANSRSQQPRSATSQSHRTGQNNWLSHAPEDYKGAWQKCELARKAFKSKRILRDKYYQEITSIIGGDWKTNKAIDLRNQAKNGRVQRPWVAMKKLKYRRDGESWADRTREMNEETSKAEYALEFVTEDIKRLGDQIDRYRQQSHQNILSSIVHNFASNYTATNDPFQQAELTESFIRDVCGTNSFSGCPPTGVSFAHQTTTPMVSACG
ncbi:hypothetical protein L204_102798 [Cryptococcus depauperatus]